MNPYEAVRKHKALKGKDIHYACESGSRAWGFHSEDSDYDLRLIYLEPTNWHLAIEQHTADNTISFKYFEENGNEVDVHGWEMGKLLALMRASNTTAFEWLNSPIVYYERGLFMQHVRHLMFSSYSPAKTAYHFLGLAQKHFIRYVYGKDNVSIKKYLYILRSLFLADWAIENKEYPPKVMAPVLTSSTLPTYMKDSYAYLASAKIKAREESKIGISEAGHEIKLLNGFIEEALIDLRFLNNNRIKMPQPGFGPYNLVLRKMLKYQDLEIETDMLGKSQGA